MRTRRQIRAGLPSPAAGEEEPVKAATPKRKAKRKSNADSYVLKRLSYDQEVGAAQQEGSEGGSGAEESDDKPEAGGPLHDDGGDGSSDDEAPEEVSLAEGKKEQEALRAQEKKAASTPRPSKRKGGKTTSGAAEEQQEEAPDAGPVEQDSVVPDVLPENVLERLGDDEDGHVEPVPEASEGGGEEHVAKKQKTQKKKKRKGTMVMDKGPIQVQVLGTGSDEPRSSESAANFLQSRFHGGNHKRSHTMLQPAATLRRVGPAAKFV